MTRKKSPEKNALIKEFLAVFWEDFKTPLISSFRSAFNKGELNNFQKQAVIKLTSKKIEAKDLLKIGDQYLY